MGRAQKNTTSKSANLLVPVDQGTALSPGAGATVRRARRPTTWAAAAGGAGERSGRAAAVPASRPPAAAAAAAARRSSLRAAEGIGGRGGGWACAVSQNTPGNVEEGVGIWGWESRRQCNGSVSRQRRTPLKRAPF